MADPKKRNRADIARAINKDELKRYLSERGKVSHIFDLLEKIEDDSTPMDAIDLQRKKVAIDTRLSLLKKYLPDERSVEVKNAEGEVFQSSVATTFNFVPVGPND